MGSHYVFVKKEKNICYPFLSGALYHLYCYMSCLRKKFYVHQSFPSGLLNEGPNDSQCGVKGSLIMIQGFVVLKRLKLLPKY